jgi:hypothetical protein
MARRKSNPDHNSTMLLVVGGAAAVAFYGYTQGWFNTTAVTASAPAPTQNPAMPNNPITSATTQVVNTPVPAPPLGTPVNDANSLAAQLKANYAYIIPGPSIASNIAALAPNYVPITTTDNGLLLLRPDVASIVTSQINNRLVRAGGATLTSLQAATGETLAMIQQAMSSANLSGLRGLSGGAWG